MKIRRPHVSTYVSAVGLLAAGMLLLADWQTPSPNGEFWHAFGALLGLALLAEIFSTRMSGGTATTAVSFVPYIASIVLLGAPWAMAVAGMTELAAETVIRRKESIKVVHNTAKEIVAIGSAGTLYVLLGGVPSFVDFRLAPVAFAVAITVYFVLSNGATATAISLSSTASLKEAWGRVVGKSLLYDLFASSLALLLAFLYIELQLKGLMLVIIPLFFIRHANHINRQLEEANRDLLDLMVKAIEARDPYTSGHSQRVARLASVLARDMGLGFKEVEKITTAALLHDVGKIYEEFAPILRKEGKLSKEERSLMQSHPIRSAELVSTISNLRGYVERCVRHHHENYDGSGYPHSVAGEDIPLGARIVMIADTTDAMTTDRPYRMALSFERVLVELEKYSGKQFDPRLVEAFRNSATVRTIVASRGQAVAPITKSQRPRWRVRAAR